MIKKSPIILLVLALATSAVGADSDSKDAQLTGFSPTGGDGVTVYEIPIEGTIDLGLAAFAERMIDRAEPDDVLLFRVKTFGGRVDAAVRIRDAMLGSKATCVVYIDRRAISAGALISLAADTIFMSEGASIGAATPVQSGQGGEMKATSEKVVSYMRAEMRATAEAKGRRADIAEAMVDAEIEIKGVSDKGKLLTLTSVTALELDIADAVVPNYDAAIERLNLGDATRVVAGTDWGEKIARFLTDPTVSSLLLTFGMLGILLELYSPGFGVGGAIGVVCLALFFLGQYAAHLAGLEELLLILAGVGFLLLEAFVIPGFGVAGILGLVAVFAGLLMALIELNIPWDVALDLGIIQEALGTAAIRMAIVLVALVIGSLFLMRRFSSMKVPQPLILDAGDQPSDGELRSTSVDYGTLMGRRGVAQTVLRPSGFVEFDGERITALTEGDFVQPGEHVEVIRVHGNEVTVKKV